jgi:hypothetical protein
MSFNFYIPSTDDTNRVSYSDWEYNGGIRRSHSYKRTGYKTGSSRFKINNKVVLDWQDVGTGAWTEEQIRNNNGNNNNHCHGG